MSHLPTENTKNFIVGRFFCFAVDRHIFEQEKPHAVWSAVETHQEHNISNTN